MFPSCVKNNAQPCLVHAAGAPRCKRSPRVSCGAPPWAATLASRGLFPVRLQIASVWMCSSAQGVCVFVRVCVFVHVRV